ncbi:putative sugar O-methyltransferase [Labrys neptuniae]
MSRREFLERYITPLKHKLFWVRYDRRAKERLQKFVHRDLNQLNAVGAISNGDQPHDDEIIPRIIAAYKVNIGENSEPSHIWKDIFDNHLLPLHKALVGSDQSAIENILRRPGDSILFYGIEGSVNGQFSAHLKKRPDSPLLRELWIAPHDHLIRFAEIIGALPYENPERRGSRKSKKLTKYGQLSTDAIVDFIESKLGFELQFPNPYPDELGVKTKRGIASFRAVHAIHQAWLIKNLVKDVANPRVLEIGGGLGRTAYYARQMGIQDYTIIDLPTTAVSHGYFLMRTLGEKNVTLHGEGNGGPSDKVKLFRPETFLEGSQRYDLIINVDSLPEMGQEVASSYWRKIRQSAPAFLSINQEADGLRVQDLAEADPVPVKFAIRNSSGMRKGYVEEIFWF